MAREVLLMVSKYSTDYRMVGVGFSELLATLN